MLRLGTLFRIHQKDAKHDRWMKHSEPQSLGDKGSNPFFVTLCRMALSNGYSIVPISLGDEFLFQRILRFDLMNVWLFYKCAWIVHMQEYDDIWWLTNTSLPIPQFCKHLPSISVWKFVILDCSCWIGCE